jgi:N-acetylglucosamine-6-phosphate deacetylase
MTHATQTASSQEFRGLIATEQGFVQGRLDIAQGLIKLVLGELIEQSQVRDLAHSKSLPIIVPGFVDLHVHGAGGVDMMDGGDACQTMAITHAKHGTTALLATTLTAPKSDLTRAFEGVRSAMQATSNLGATILGVHLEGPYISPDRLGAQPPFARNFDLAEFSALHAIAPIRVVTVAPELPNLDQVFSALRALGVIAQLGHSAATYEQGKLAFEAGARGVTHLYNAMSALHHRAPGLVGAALAHSEYAELIPDLIHVHPGAIRVAMRAIKHCYCVTDSTAAAGMPDGEYRLGTHTVTKCMGGVRLADGTLAGSTLTMDQAFANLVNELGLDLSDAVKRCSSNACSYLGINNRGVLKQGCVADVVVMNADLKIQSVLVNGRLQDLS